MKRTFVIHPFLFAIFPILFLFSRNVDIVRFFSVSEVLLPSAIVLGATLLLVLLSRLILGDSKKAGIIVSIFLILFFSYGHVRDIVWGRQIGGLAIGRHIYLMPACGVLFVCGAYWTMRTRRELRDFTNVLNVVAFSLIVLSLFNIGAYELRSGGVW